MAKVRKKSAIPVYAFASIWLFWALFLPMYKISHFMILIFVSYSVYKFNGLIFRGKKIEVPDPEPEPVLTGNQELDEMIWQGHQAIHEMRRLSKTIQNGKLTAKINQLDQLTEKIFRHVEKNPSKIPQIRKFMNYYLPTTLKLLNTYAEMSSQGVRGDNINATMAKVEQMMDTIVAAFAKQLDALFGAEALDISTDITVLEGMLQREGLANNDMKMQQSAR